MAKKEDNPFTLELLILNVLNEKDCYGYEIMRAIHHASNDVITPKMGTIYPVLYNLLDHNYISSYEKSIKTKIRIYYHIEPLGRELYNEMLWKYDSIVGVINAIVHKEG